MYYGRAYALPIACIAISVFSGAACANSAATSNESAAQVKSQMRSLKKQMNARMNRLESQLNRIQNSKSNNNSASKNKSLRKKASNRQYSQEKNKGSQVQKLQTKIQNYSSLQAHTVKKQKINSEKIKKVAKQTKQNTSFINKFKNTKLDGFLQLDYRNQLGRKNSANRFGDVKFDNFVLQLSKSSGKLTYQVGYRFYSYMRTLKKAWGAYHFNKHNLFRAGLFQVPFGNMPYGYRSYYGNLGYYMGFNSNQNAGVEYKHTGHNWNAEVAFFKDSNVTSNNKHYGTNPIAGGKGPFGGKRSNRAVNQGLLRVGYTFGKGTNYSTNFNISAKGGELYNNTTHNAGSDWAAALGYKGQYGNFLAEAQATDYKYNPKDPSSVTKTDLIQVGSFDENWLIPAKGQIFSASAAYTFNVNWGALKSVTVSNDYSYLHAGSGIRYDFKPNALNVADPQVDDLGAYWSAPPFFMWTDLVNAKNFFGFVGQENNNWHQLVIGQFGIYF